VHVPFCEWICPFCPYNKVLARPALAARYFSALDREVAAYVSAARRARGPDVAFSSLYVGGGTPTLYPDELAALLDAIPVSGERAVEVLPNHAARLPGLAQVGFTAVSIGAQSFHDPVLARLHRPHDAQMARDAVAAAIGLFACVDVDLIVDVALEDAGRFPGAFLSDVRTCFELGVDQVSTYPLMRFGYTPFGTAHHDRRREHEVLAQATRLAEDLGYQRRSVWTFNRAGAAPYTSITRRRFLGMGAGSSSFTGRDFHVNHFGVGTYIDCVTEDSLPIARTLHLAGLGGAAYDAFWQAYAGGIDVASLARSYGSWAWAACGLLEPMSALGLVRREGSSFKLTPRGFDAYHDLERFVTYELIEPLWAQMLAEHRSEGATAHWAAPEKGRSGRLWSVVSRLLEQAPADRASHRDLARRPVRLEEVPVGPHRVQDHSWPTTEQQ
jgi:menaquinone C8-methyltransferase